MVSNMKNQIKDLIQIDRNEVLRYLEYKNQNIDNELCYKIEKCREKTKTIINPRFIFRKYKIDKIKKDNSKNQIRLQNTNFILESNDLYNLLSNCDECMMISSTLGLEIEKEIRRLTYTNLTEGIIVDACATTAIEEVCDIIQGNIKQELLIQKKYITSRYSPGYGDLDITKNLEINNLLNSSKEIGLMVNDSGIMIPRKSVVAIIGISCDEIKVKKNSCENCSNRHSCNYKKEGDSCGN